MTREHTVAAAKVVYMAFFESFVAMAHRGGYVDPADKDRENSLFAFNAAVELGFKYLETDVHATRDGKLIAFHDDRLDRVTDRHGFVAKLPFREVRKAKIAGIDQIPTLDEVLEAFPKTRFNIDLKAPQAIWPLAETLKKHNARNRVCVASFSQRRLNRFKRLMPDVATSFSTLAVVWNGFVPILPKLLSFKGEAFQVPVSQHVAGMEITVTSKRLVETAKRANKMVHVWTINDADMIRKLIDLGVNGIISDRPDLLKQIAIEKGVWHA